MVWFRTVLATIAMVSVSGIHLVFMQACAWTAMAWERDASRPARPLMETIGDFIGAREFCARCVSTIRAGLNAHDDSREGKTPGATDLAELRLIPSDSRPLALTPPAPGRLPARGEGAAPEARIDAAPPSPPPEFAA